MEILHLLPAGVHGTSFALLVLVSFFGSLITAAAGIGGGIILLAVMANTMPTAAVIPVHGVVQLGSNIGRAGFLRAYIDRSIVAYFGVGAIVGVAMGSSVVVALPAQILRVALAVFILYSVWGPSLRPANRGKIAVAAVGVVASFLTMFIGATGTFVSAVLRQRGYNPQQLVATHSVCMGGQHALKVIAFAALGFAFADWSALIGLMLLSGLAGTYVGGKLLHRVPVHMFNAVLRALLTLLALNLLVTVWRG